MRAPIAIRCLCGEEPRCPFHTTVIHGESAFDRICRESREAVRQRLKRGENSEYGGPDHHLRSRFDGAVIAEIDRRLAAAGIPNVVGRATPESIAAQQATVAKPPAKPAVGKIAPGKPTIVLARAVSPGYAVLRVPHRKDGRTRDRFEAAQDFAHEPWAADVRYLGSSGTYADAHFLFERPDERQQRLKREQTARALQRSTDVDVLAPIRQYQTVEVRSTWIVEDGWARPQGTPKPNVAPRVEPAPSLRGKPPVAVCRDRRDPVVRQVRPDGLCAQCVEKPHRPQGALCWRCTKRNQKRAA